MADADEDARPRDLTDAADIDLSDETQDFHFLNLISRQDAKIPKRGEKDFEPHATALQSSVLDASRAAMHDALSFTRVHFPKKRLLAYYDPATNTAYTDFPRSPLFKSMGRVKTVKVAGQIGQSTNRLWLLPEEALYLLERGTIDIQWPLDDKDEDEPLPMSLQGAYAAFIGRSDEFDDGLTFERYSVYAALKRMGYAVHRASTWNQPPSTPEDNTFPSQGSTWSRLGLTLGHWRQYMFSFTYSPKDADTLIQPSTYRSYADIYKRLSLVRYYDPSKQSRALRTSVVEPVNPLRVTYNVYKPNNTIYKKSAPGPPDFSIVVVDGRESLVPSLSQIDHLLASLPYTPPADSGQLYQKLRHGYKSVILAIVDQGVTNYLRVADAGFGTQKLYQRNIGPRNSKRSGNRPPVKAK